MLQVKVEGEFMFGPDWLVVPITQPKVSQWKVYLPRWNVQIIYILQYTYYIHITMITVMLITDTIVKLITTKMTQFSQTR